MRGRYEVSREGSDRVVYRWLNEAGQRCTRFICEAIGSRAGNVEPTEVAAEIAAALNALGAEPRGAHPLA